MNLMMLTKFFSPHFGGVEKHVELLSEELIKRGHSVTLITEQFTTDLPLIEIKFGIKIVRIPYFALNSKRLIWTWMSEHEDLFADADLVHIHDVFWWYWPIRLLLLFKPVYITFHGYEGSNPPTKKAIIQRKVSEKICRGSICVGEFMKKWYYASPTLIMYGASISSKLIRVKPDDNAIFWGRLDVDTGISVYSEAIQKIPNLSLYIFGDGPLLDEVREANIKNVTLNSWVKNISLEIHRHKYAFVSRYLSILEAMQAKRLVFAVYNNEIKRDYLMCHPMRDNMIIAGTASELVKRFNEIKKNPAKQKRMIDAAYTWANEQTWEKLADQYEQLWAK